MKIILLLTYFVYANALATPVFNVSISAHFEEEVPELERELNKFCRLELEAIEDVHLTDRDVDNDFIIIINARANVKGLEPTFYAISMLISEPGNSPRGIKSSVYTTVYDASLVVTDKLVEYCQVEIKRFNNYWLALDRMLEPDKERFESDGTSECECTSDE